MLWLFDPISMENRLWDDRIGTVSVRCRQFKNLSGTILEAYSLLSYLNLRTGSWSDHHENSTTMILYGYNLM
jgi:hypothetical protein